MNDNYQDNKFVCHIVGLNLEDKKSLEDLILQGKKNNNIKQSLNKYNIIDLDKLNDKILEDKEMNKMFKQYSKLKKNKNDKNKDVDKKMTKYWEDNLIIQVYNLIPAKKKSILIGKNHHYRILSKKINFSVSNKFILDNNIEKEVKNKIKQILENRKYDIINGTFPVLYLDYNYLLKKRKNFEESYLKCGYIKMKLNDIIKILNQHSQNKIKGKGLWLSLRESYNIGSQIYPKTLKNLLPNILPLFSSPTQQKDF